MSERRGSMMNLVKKPLPPAEPPVPPPELEALVQPEQFAAFVAEQGRELKQAESQQQDSDKSSAVKQEASTKLAASLQEISSNISDSKTKLQLRPGAEKVPIVSRTYRLPEPLCDRLKKIANYNKVHETAIVAEALELHLENFPHPPEQKLSESFQKDIMNLLNPFWLGTFLRRHPLLSVIYHIFKAGKSLIRAFK